MTRFLIAIYLSWIFYVVHRRAGHNEITSDRNNYKIEFSVEDWDMTGTLWVKNSGNL